MMTYATCHDLMHQFGKGNDLVVSQLEAADFKVDAGTATHLCRVAEEVYRLRKKIWIDKLGNNSFAESLRTVNDVEVQLSHLRRDLITLSRFCQIRFFPDQLKNVLHKDLLQFVDHIREEWKKRLPVSGPGEQMRLLLNKTISSALLQQQTDAEQTAGSSSLSRKIIF